ncbi:MAG: hypothetical protein CMP07_10455 [Xanthomonadales bacterium]|nr:hypothetical protein [Xanthomonadales bacterium]
MLDRSIPADRVTIGRHVITLIKVIRRERDIILLIFPTPPSAVIKFDACGSGKDLCAQAEQPENQHEQ